MTDALIKQIEKNYGTFTYLGFTAGIGMALDLIRAGRSDQVYKLLMMSEAETIAAVNARTQKQVGRKHSALAKLEEQS